MAKNKNDDVTDLAPEGTIWVCPACGKRASDRYNGGISRGWDVSCSTWANLCHVDSLEMSADDPGRVAKARAVSEAELSSFV